MSTNFKIYEYINMNPVFSDLSLELTKKNISSKEYKDDNLCLFYHNFEKPSNTELERECRSLIIDTNTNKVISYSCDTPLINNDAQEFLAFSKEEKVIFKCYEGSLISLFNHNNKWYVSTRKHINNNNLSTSERQHFTLFDEALNKFGYTFEQLTEKLNNSLCYHFVLIHHKNKYVIDYTNEFGENYIKLCLISVKNKETQNEVDIHNVNNDFNSFLSKDIFISQKYDSMDECGDLTNINSDQLSEGIVVKVYNSNTYKYTLLKFQTLNYQLKKYMGNDDNNFKMFLFLFQHNKLHQYLSENMDLQKVVNPTNNKESYDVVGVLNSVFKVLTFELFELFKSLYDLKDGKQQNNMLYKYLPKEYKYFMFNIKGLYYKKKANKNSNKSYYLQMNDVYNYLKTVETVKIYELLKVRKLMFNLSKHTNDMYNFSKHLVDKNNKLNFKLVGVYTSVLYPEIKDTDIYNMENNV